jgi:hypothetical protein
MKSPWCYLKEKAVGVDHIHYLLLAVGDLHHQLLLLLLPSEALELLQYSGNSSFFSNL